MSGGAFTRCRGCKRLLIYGQTCVCGVHPWRRTTPPPAPSSTPKEKP